MLGSTIMTMRSCSGMSGFDGHHQCRREARDQRERDVGPQQVGDPEEPDAVAGTAQYLEHAEKDRQLR